MRCGRSPKRRGSLRCLPPLEVRPSSVAPDPAESRGAPPRGSQAPRRAVCGTRGLCGRCTGVAVPLRVVPSPTGLPSKRGPCTDDHFDHSKPSIEGCQVQRCFQLAVSDGRIGELFQENSNYLRVSVLSCTTHGWYHVLLVRWARKGLLAPLHREGS